MQQQVITISAAGVMSGLQVKPGRGVNLQTFGRAKTTRASEIVWDEEAQRWRIDALVQPVIDWAGGSTVTPAYFHRAGCDAKTFACEFETGKGFFLKPLHFRDYDEAVRAEIAYLDALRLRGIH